MDSPWPENLPFDRKRVLGELNRGREFANQLRIMLSKPFKEDEHGWVCAKDLVSGILGSLSDTLCILNSGESDEVSQVPANTRRSSPPWDGRKSEDSGESSKTSALKDRRGSYKRRKTSDTWTKETHALVDDGHAWRKYGQKSILNAKYPRNYFRCTHKYDQGCQATKQVQQIEDDPLMYRTTYSGHHTCTNLLKASHILLDSTTTTTREASFLLSFEANNSAGQKPNDPFYQSFPLIKQESKEKVPSLNRQSSSADYLLSPDLATFETSGPMTVLSSGSDHGDVISSGVYSCTASTHSMEMDHLMEPVDFDDLQFEF